MKPKQYHSETNHHFHRQPNRTFTSIEEKAKDEEEHARHTHTDEDLEDCTATIQLLGIFTVFAAKVREIRGSGFKD